MKKILIILCITLSLLQAKKTKGTMSKSVFETLNKSQEFLLKKEYNSSLKLLKTVINSNKNDYEKSYALQYAANIFIEKNNYKKASSYYEKIIKLKAFEEDNIDKIKYSLSRIYLSLEKYKECIILSKELLLSKAVNKQSVYENLIYSSYYKDDFKNSIFYINTLFKDIKKPAESLYQILYSSYIQLRNYKKAISTLKIMLKTWHKNENYWLQLISLYQENKDYKKSLATFELAYKKNGLKRSKHTLYFANVLLQNNLYNKAAIVISDALKKKLIKKDRKILETLVSSYLNARQIDDAINVLKSSKFLKKPKFSLLLANLYYNKLDYKETIKVLKSNKFSKHSKEEGKKFTLMALCSHELENKKDSKKYLHLASLNKYEKSRAKQIAKSLGIKI